MHSQQAFVLKATAPCSFDLLSFKNKDLNLSIHLLFVKYRFGLAAFIGTSLELGLYFWLILLLLPVEIGLNKIELVPNHKQG